MERSRPFRPLHHAGVAVLVAVVCSLSLTGGSCQPPIGCQARHIATVKGTLTIGGTTAAEPRNRAEWYSEGSGLHCTGIWVDRLSPLSGDGWEYCYANFLLARLRSCTGDSPGFPTIWVHNNTDGSYGSPGDYTIKTTVYAHYTEINPRLACSVVGSVPPGSRFSCHTQSIQ